MGGTGYVQVQMLLAFDVLAVHELGTVSSLFLRAFVSCLSRFCDIYATSCHIELLVSCQKCRKNHIPMISLPRVINSGGRFHIVQLFLNVRLHYSEAHCAPIAVPSGP